MISAYNTGQDPPNMLSSQSTTPYPGQEKGANEAKNKLVNKRKPSGIKMVESNQDDINFIQNFLNDAP